MIYANNAERVAHRRWKLRDEPTGGKAFVRDAETETAKTVQTGDGISIELGRRTNGVGVLDVNDCVWLSE